MHWQGEQVLRQAETEVNRNVQAAAIHLQNKTREKLSVAGRTVSHQPISKGKNKGKMRKVVGAMGSNPSKPGEAPRKQTGTLRSSIAHEMVEPNRALIGTALKVGKWMELGTVGGKIIRPKNKKALANVALGLMFGKRVKQGAIKPRPFLRSTLAEEKQNIVSIIGGKLPAGVIAT